MNQIDKSQWLMVIIKLEGFMTMDDANAYTGALDEALNREAPFSVVIYSDQNDNKNREAGVTKHQMAWVKANKPRISGYCKGLASVTPHISMLGVWRTMLKVMGPRMYGCPADMFTSMDEARAWAKSQVAAR